MINQLGAQDSMKSSGLDPASGQGIEASCYEDEAEAKYHKTGLKAKASRPTTLRDTLGFFFSI